MRDESSDNLIGFERLLALFKDVQKQTPSGVGLKRETKPYGTYILLQFKVGSKRVAKACGCTFTQLGMVEALQKANKVAEALSTFSTETEFWNWYDQTILAKNTIQNDLVSFKQAIEIAESYFWNSIRKNGVRDRSNPSHQSCWYDAYGRFYKNLPLDKVFNTTDILQVVNSKEKGTKNFKMCVRAMKKLAQLNNQENSYRELEKINATQVKFKQDLQNVSLDDFLQMREQILDVPANDKRYRIESRKSWLFVFSMQVIYGLRISEVFAVRNIDQSFITKDGIVIPSLNDPTNKDMVVVVGNETLLGTTTKTGYRLSIPLVPPTHNDLINKLEIKSGQLPKLTLNSDNPVSARHKYTKTARNNLMTWLKGKFTQTHALRHLSNLHGIMSGVSLEKRAMSLGHSPAMNDSTYKRRRTTQTTLDLLTNFTHQTIPLASAINVAKQLEFTDTKSVTLISSIYNIPEGEIVKLLNIN
jgi:integrase